MGVLNGMPIVWGPENDQLLGSLFPGGPSILLPVDENTNFPSGSSDYKSPFNQSVFLNMNDAPATGDIENDPANTTYIYYCEFNNEKDLNSFFIGIGENERGQKVSDILAEKIKGQEAPLKIICCYLKAGELLLIRLSNDVARDLASRDQSDLDTMLNFHSNEIERIHKTGYDLKTIRAALENAIPFASKQLKDRKKLTKENEQLYNDNYVRLLRLAGFKKNETPDPQTDNAIRLLCATMVDIDYDVLQTYNKQGDVVYNTDSSSRDNLTAEDMLSMIRRLRKLSKEIKTFKDAEFTSVQELMKFVNNNLVDNSATDRVNREAIIYPIKNLSQQKRRELLLLLLNGDDLIFHGSFRSFRSQFGTHLITKGDIVYLLFATATDADRFQLIVQLDELSKIFDMMEFSDDNEFLFATMYLVGATVKVFIQEADQPALFSAAIAAGNFLFYDDDKSSAYSAALNMKEKKIFLANQIRIDLDSQSLLESAIKSIVNQVPGIFHAPPELPDKTPEQLIYEQLYVSPKTEFDPLELIAFRAESDIESSILTMKKGELVLLPACLIYLLFKERELTKDNFTFLLTLTLLLLPVGIAGLVAAIEAANTVGIIITSTDIIVDGTILAANVPEVQKNNPEFTKAVNTFAFFYGLMGLARAIPGSIKKAGSVNKNLVDALKITKQRTVKFFEELKSLFKSSSKPEALFREIFKLINKGKISEFQFNRIARRIEADSGIKMHLVDATNKQFKELYAKWKEEPVYATFHSHTFKNTRYGIVLEGPSIYFFRGGDIELTSYTLQHELFHVKLWYKLVKEFGNKGGLSLYNKIPGWLHEADVIGEFLKQNKFKPGKWGIREIEYDLKVVNDKIRTNPVWKNSFSKIASKENLTLKDLENWDIANWIDKL